MAEKNSDKKDNTIKKRTVKKEKTKDNDMYVVNKTVNFSLTEVIVIILITGIVVSITSGLIIYNNYDKVNKSENVVTNEDFTEFEMNYNQIIENYVEEVDKDKLIESAIQGMYNYLDDGYSMYLNTDDTSSLEEQLTGNYTGIGVEIKTEVNKNGVNETIINRTFKDSPAEKAGLKSGDILVKIDGEAVVDSEWVVNTVKKGNKESYEVTYKRDGKEHTVTLKREKVYINSVSTNTYGSVGYIKIDTFSATTKEQMIKAINSFDKDIKSLVIDVRDNTGGYLTSAYETADLLVEKGKVIYQLKDRDSKITKYEAETGVLRKFDKIVVLINEYSASASEILALALKESAGAKLVGVKSFGKGTVQETSSLSSGAMVKYTTSYWLSPNGNSINKEGIKPDVEVKDENKQIDEAVKVAK